MSLIIVGGILLLVGLSYLFLPAAIKKVNQMLNKVLFLDEATFTYRIVTGILFLAVSIYMIITGILLIKR